MTDEEMLDWLEKFIKADNDPLHPRKGDPWPHVEFRNGMLTACGEHRGFAGLRDLIEDAAVNEEGGKP